MDRLVNLDYRIFPIIHIEEVLSDPNDWASKKIRIIHEIANPCRFVRTNFLNARSVPPYGAYNNLLAPHFQVWKQLFLPVSNPNLNSIFQYVYHATTANHFYENFPKTDIEKFHKELEVNSKFMAKHQTFYRGAESLANFKEVGDTLIFRDKVLSTTLSLGAAASHASRKSFVNSRRVSNSTIYVIRNSSNNIKGYVVNHEGIDLNAVVHNMEHEFEVILSPPFKLKITSKEVIGNYELLFIRLDHLENKT